MQLTVKELRQKLEWLENKGHGDRLVCAYENGYSDPDSVLTGIIIPEKVELAGNGEVCILEEGGAYQGEGFSI